MAAEVAAAVPQDPQEVRHERTYRIGGGDRALRWAIREAAAAAPVTWPAVDQ